MPLLRSLVGMTEDSRGYILLPAAEEECVGCCMNPAR